MRIITAFLLVSSAWAQSRSYLGRPAVELSNDKLTVLVLPGGATIGSIVLKEDVSGVNPLWQPNQTGNGIGHFLCLDGFGPVSNEEQNAGLRFHGEAVLQNYAVRQENRGDVQTVVLSARLPLVQEQLTRTVQLVEGESVLYVSTRLESMVAFDRPISWAEHATIGSTFLQRGVTVVDLPAVRSKTRPYQDPGSTIKRRLASDQEFKWPMAPLTDGRMVDLRAAPEQSNSTDHTTSLLDRSQPLSFVTAFNRQSRLLIGWVFRTADFPWLQSWEYYPNNGVLARGLEFSTQPFDVPRRQAVALNGMFDAPTFRWLPARSTLDTSFLIFYTQAPDGFERVSSVRFSDDGLVIQDGTSGQTITLKASMQL